MAFRPLAAGSGGDLLPWAFRKKGLGVLVGKRTWGGLVGITDYPSMQDGTWITAPNMGIWDEKGWIVDGKLYIDPAREAFLDLSKSLKDNGIGHKDLVRLTTPGLDGIAGTGY